MEISITETNASLGVRFRGLRSQFDEALNALKDEIPPRSRRFDPEERCWLIDPECRKELDRWARRMRHELRASVVFETTTSRSGPLVNNRVSDAYTTLHILPTAPPELVKAAYRCLAMMHHPDRGGETETMQRINQAYAQLSGRAGRA